MRRMAISMMVVAGLLVPAVAQAQSPETPKVEASTDKPAEAKKGGLILAGARVGGIVPFSGLSPFVTVGIEVGYVFPWLDQALALAVHMDYTEPKKDGTQTDSRLNGTTTTYDWKLREQELTVMPVVMYRLTMLGKFVPYIGVGPRIYMLKSTTKASVGDAQISETTEKNTKVGVGIPIGVEYSIGPGGIIAELLFQYGGLDHKITGATNTGAMSLALGYRFLF
jgi:opacity protein-like surface antigen